MEDRSTAVSTEPPPLYLKSSIRCSMPWFLNSPKTAFSSGSKSRVKALYIRYPTFCPSMVSVWLMYIGFSVICDFVRVTLVGVGVMVTPSKVASPIV